MHGKVAALLRRSREEDSHSVDQAGAICQASQHVMVGEETDAPLGMLLLSGAPVPGDGRDAERQSHQRAERRRRQHERLEENPALFRLVDEGRDDGDRPLIDDDGNVGPRKKPRQVGRMGLLHIDDRLPAFDCARRVGAEFRYIDERDFVVLRYKLRISLAIENFVAKDRTGISRRPKKQHGGGRWLLAGGDLLEIGRADAQILRPVACGHGRILIKQVIDRDFDGRPGAGDQDGENHDKDADVAPESHFCERQHLIARPQRLDLRPDQRQKFAIMGISIAAQSSTTEAKTGCGLARSAADSSETFRFGSDFSCSRTCSSNVPNAPRCAQRTIGRCICG